MHFKLIAGRIYYRSITSLPHCLIVAPFSKLGKQPERAVMPVSARLRCQNSGDRHLLSLGLQPVTWSV